MKKTLYIHIGRPKVGSTAIQYFLWKNKDLLARNDYLYPETGRHHNASHKLALVLIPSLPNARIVKGVSPNKMYRALIEEAKRSRLKNVVISSEMFYLLDEPAKFPNEIFDYFDVKIICYVRRQDEVLLSSYVQEVKDNLMALEIEFDEYLEHETRLALLDYKNILDKWANVFGKENIIVRVYDKTKMHGTIYEDFLEAIELELKHEYQTPPSYLNPSPPRDVLELINHFNKYPVSGYVLNQLREPLLELSKKIGIDHKFDINTLLPQAKRRKIMETFAESNRQTALTYLRDESGELFNINFEDDINYDSNTYKGIELDRFIQMSAGLFVNQQKLIFNMNTRLQEQQKRIQVLEGKNQIVNKDTGWLSRLRKRMSKIGSKVGKLGKDTFLWRRQG